MYAAIHIIKRKARRVRQITALSLPFAPDLFENQSAHCVQGAPGSKNKVQEGYRRVWSWIARNSRFSILATKCRAEQSRANISPPATLLRPQAFRPCLLSHHDSSHESFLHFLPGLPGLLHHLQARQNRQVTAAPVEGRDIITDAIAATRLNDTSSR